MQFLAKDAFWAVCVAPHRKIELGLEENSRTAYADGAEKRGDAETSGTAKLIDAAHIRRIGFTFRECHAALQRAQVARLEESLKAAVRSDFICRDRKYSTKSDTSHRQRPMQMHPPSVAACWRI